MKLYIYSECVFDNFVGGGRRVSQNGTGRRGEEKTIRGRCKIFCQTEKGNLAFLLSLPH